MAQANQRQGDATHREPSEMLIVDTFTRLIFGDRGEYGPEELGVVEALRRVEPDVAADDLPAMGDYLRSLGVAEMVTLVARVQNCVGQYPVLTQGETASSAPARVR